MAKYKLIKKFPGSAFLGTVIDTDDVAFGITYNYTDYPEFWEKVGEKDWEVLKTEYIPGKRGFDTDDTSSMYKITSIKRKCDREIFSVGDKLDLRDGEVRKITGISLDDTGVSEFSKRSIPWLECGKDYGTCLDLAVHYKEPILITEDGVDLYEGDTVYITSIDANFLSERNIRRDDPVFNKNVSFKFFAKEENVANYIKENKPMYSRKEVRDFGGYILRNLKGVMPMKLLFELWLKEKGE